MGFYHFPHTWRAPSFLLSQHARKHTRSRLQARDARPCATRKASHALPNALRDTPGHARLDSREPAKSKAVGPSPKPTITVHGMIDNIVAPHLPGRGRWASAGPNRGWEHAQGGARGEGTAAHRPHVPRRMRRLDDCSSRAAEHQLVRRLRPRSKRRRCAASHRHAPGGGAAGQVAVARGRSSSAREEPRASLKRVKLLGKVVFSTDFSREVEPDRLDSAHLRGGEHDLGLVPCVPGTKSY